MDVLHQRFLPIFYYLEENYMKNKDKTISLRLTNEEYSILESNSNNLNMNTSQYLRSMINNALPAETDYRQHIAPIMCRVQIRLVELGLEDDEIVKEISKLCLML